jgi:hypothetical protein
MRILLAGTHRCGSTWVANVLGRTTGIHNVYEPDEPATDILGTLSSDQLGTYPALTPTDESSRYSMVWDLAFAGGWPWRPSPARRRVGRLIRKVPTPIRSRGLAALVRVSRRSRSRSLPVHILVKSANCALALEWIEQRYRPQVVVQHRNPLNLVSSWMALGIDGDPSLAEDPVVQERWLKPLGIPILGPEASPVASVAWTIGLLMVALKTTAETHPDWIVISHDEFCQDPHPRFEALCKDLGLTWTAAAAAYLDASDRPTFVDRNRNPRKVPDEQLAGEGAESLRRRQAELYRRRLSKAEIAEASAVLASLPLGDWAPGAEG